MEVTINDILSVDIVRDKVLSYVTSRGDLSRCECVSKAFNTFILQWYWNKVDTLRVVWRLNYTDCLEYGESWFEVNDALGCSEYTAAVAIRWYFKRSPRISSVELSRRQWPDSAHTITHELKALLNTLVGIVVECSTDLTRVSLSNDFIHCTNSVELLRKHSASLVSVALEGGAMAGPTEPKLVRLPPDSNIMSHMAVACAFHSRRKDLLHSTVSPELYHAIVPGNLKQLTLTGLNLSKVSLHSQEDHVLEQMSLLNNTEQPSKQFARQKELLHAFPAHSLKMSAKDNEIAGFGFGAAAEGSAMPTRMILPEMLELDVTWLSYPDTTKPNPLCEVFSVCPALSRVTLRCSCENVLWTLRLLEMAVQLAALWLSGREDSGQTSLNFYVDGKLRDSLAESLPDNQLLGRSTVSSQTSTAIEFKQGQRVVLLAML